MTAINGTTAKQRLFSLRMTPPGVVYLNKKLFFSTRKSENLMTDMLLRESRQPGRGQTDHKFLFTATRFESFASVV